MQVIFDKEIENLNSLVKLRKSIKKLEKENKELKLRLEDIEYDIELINKRT